jgi:hypothetical protein
VRQCPAFFLSHVTILMTRARKVIVIYLVRAAEAVFSQITMKEWSLTRLLARKAKESVSLPQARQDAKSTKEGNEATGTSPAVRVEGNQKRSRLISDGESDKELGRCTETYMYLSGVAS